LEALRKEIEEMRRNKTIEDLVEEKVKTSLKDLKSDLDELKKSISTGEGASVTPLQYLKTIADQVDEIQTIFSKLGFKIEKGKGGEETVVVQPRISDKEFELKKMEAEMRKNLWEKHIGPALAELLKNPRKWIEFIETIREMAQGRIAPPSTAPVKPESTVTRPPSLEEYLSKIPIGEKGEGGGGKSSS